MSRRLVAAVVLFAVVGAVVPAVALGQSTYVTITDVEVSPANPMPGETATVEVTIRNPESSGSAFRFTDLALRGAGSADERTRIENLGTLPPGSETTVPLTATFEDDGTKRLQVNAYGRSAGSNRPVQVNFPVTVQVTDRHPRLSIDAGDPVAGVEGTGNVTVANGLESTIRNVELSVAGSENLSVSNGRSVLGRLAPGNATTAGFRFTADSPGAHAVKARLDYVTAAGTERSTDTRLLVSTDPLDDDVALNARPVGDGDDRTIAVDVLNRGNVPVDRVSLRADSQNATIGSGLVDSVPAGESRTVRLNVSSAAAVADVTVTGSYEVTGDDRSVRTETTMTSTPGRIGLTGVEVTRRAGTVQITGSASNLGLTEANAVVVSVANDSGVTPASGGGQYFVGRVPASDFGSFDLAVGSADAGRVPLTVSYLVDGERRSTAATVSVPEPRGPPPGVDPSGGSDGPPLLLIGGAAVLLVGAGLVVYVRR